MIFNLFKSKPTLKELIPEGFVDIHSHILPGIDDGAKDVDESLILISKMKKLGFSKIIGTPHTYKGLYNNTNETIKESYELISNRIDDDISIDYASEYMIDESILGKISNKSILTLKGKYVLIEMGFISAPLNLIEIIFELKTNGYIPILAHPERYAFLFHNFKLYHKLKHHGCKFQINLLSVNGYYGKVISKISDRLLKRNLIDFAGSDIHKISQIKFMNNRVNINEVEKLKEVMKNNISIFSD
tara:strand:- start:2624 stop:3358 length:735 start_codon:yes stop_codon:yes gene_type:complete